MAVAMLSPGSRLKLATKWESPETETREGSMKSPVGAVVRQLTRLARAYHGPTNSGGPTGQDGRRQHSPGAQRAVLRTDPCPEVADACRWDLALGTPSARTGERGFLGRSHGRWLRRRGNPSKVHTAIC